MRVAPLHPHSVSVVQPSPQSQPFAGPLRCAGGRSTLPTSGPPLEDECSVRPHRCFHPAAHVRTPTSFTRSPPLSPQHITRHHAVVRTHPGRRDAARGAWSAPPRRLAGARPRVALSVRRDRVEVDELQCGRDGEGTVRPPGYHQPRVAQGGGVVQLGVPGGEHQNAVRRFRRGPEGGLGGRVEDEVREGRRRRHARRCAIVC